ncbi:CD63 antigen-like isoform X2 [Sitodiplosis mosellana]|nr:CD63 antigen-like isoform X2 [Sitodiplosis mosellana]XP_055296813.1 CD63 antigen-like isoform X2 [Sitodiplosis mosellana]XP_055296814.1 CD63 antigen-like isoform X2 [Sitodiplosis mosellana]XP_055296815.1 CD63 antigen-like isoform X2 [Sitodiplosis mosellana]XP_055296816.1 CD63 antigen-like isoform X2 [Sitodiplosis mosellana]
MCKAISKTWLFVFNFIFFIGGVALCTLGGLILAYREKVDAVKNAEEPLSLGIVLVVIGAIIMIVTFLGCFGAISDNKCMLLTFAILLSLIVAAQVGVTAYGAVRIDLPKRLTSVIVGSQWNQQSHKSLIDWCQKEFECCGYRNYNDYKNDTNLILPSTCCKGHENDHKYNCPEKDAYKKGCKQAFLDFLENYRAIIIGVVVGFALIELVGIVFSCVLFFRKNRAVHY